MHADDTIVAISTPAGRGGIGVVRLAGPDALAISRGLIRLNREPEPWRATLGELLDPAGEIVDQVVLTFFRAPHSYTADDLVEVSCHGSPVVLHHLVERAASSGARLAEPGEFTMRAFLNGRIDLAQAEAVRDLIEARTLYQAKVAAEQAGGAVARRLAPAKKQLVDLVALLEAGIDFAEDDVSVLNPEAILNRIEPVRRELAEYAATFRIGRVVQEGLTLAIVGRPNVGKSSLFNRLVERDRAIVTAAPGTTRDLVSETVQIDGIPLRLVDTAGIREASDEAETIGVQKAFEAMADADLTIVVLDASAGLQSADRELLERAAGRGSTLVVWNKSDLAKPPATVPGESGGGAASHAVSALNGEGVASLRSAIVSAALPGLGDSRESGFLTNIRHERLIREAVEALDAARRAAEQSIPHEMLLLDLYGALGPLDAITGETTVEDILNQIFSTFCVGK